MIDELTYYFAKCDAFGCKECHLVVNEFAGNEDVRDDARKSGWRCDPGDDRDFCPEHVALADEDPK